MKWFAHADAKPGETVSTSTISAPSCRPFPTSRTSRLKPSTRASRTVTRSIRTAGISQGAYQLSGVSWKPKISYRYAFFEGDDVTTPQNEAFDPLFLGFYDWGTWWQGEISRRGTSSPTPTSNRASCAST